MKNIVQILLAIILILTINTIKSQPPPVPPMPNCRIANVISTNVTNHSADISWQHYSNDKNLMYKVWLYDTASLVYVNQITRDTVYHLTGLKTNTLYKWMMAVASDTMNEEHNIFDCLSNFKYFKTLTDSTTVTGVINYDANKLDLTVMPTMKEKEINVRINNTESQSDISILNLLGQKVYKTTIYGVGKLNKSIDLNNLQKGIYLINVSNSFASKTMRIII